MSGRSSITLTLRDLKVSSLGRKYKPNPCKGLLDNFLEALEIKGERNVPKSLAKSLLDCVEAPAPQPKLDTVKFHIAKFVKRDK